ncbi:hypothetical protein BH23BAC1_BH23BAC1_51610 [soil metagenome]
MEKRFLVLIDFSTYSRDQLLLAHSWGIAIKAKLLLIHNFVVVRPALTDRQTEKEIAAYEKEKALTRLKEFAYETLGEVPNIEFFASEKNLLLLIPEFLSQEYDNLTFVGLKGTGPLKKIFWGSTTIDLIKNINHTVVAVPKHLSNYSPDKFYIALNRKFQLNTSELEYLLYLFGSQIKNMVFISVITELDDHSSTVKYLRALVDKYVKLKNSSYQVFEGENAFKEIKELMEKQSNAILLVQRGSRSLIDQIFRKFLVNELVYDGSIPLIVLPE